MKNREKNKNRLKLIKGDNVLVLTGKDKGRKGKILKAFKEDRRVLVEGINMKKKRVKPKTSGKKGEVVEMPFSVDISNVKIICPKCNKASRIEKKVEENNKKRVCKKCKQDI